MSLTYQNVREQLIALQVDLDDKNKLCEVLVQRVQMERALLGRIEVDVNEEYQATLDSEARTYQEELEQLKFLANKVSRRSVRYQQDRQNTSYNSYYHLSFSTITVNGRQEGSARAVQGAGRGGQGGRSRHDYRGAQTQ